MGLQPFAPHRSSKIGAAHRSDSPTAGIPDMRHPTHPAAALDRRPEVISGLNAAVAAALRERLARTSAAVAASLAVLPLAFTARAAAPPAAAPLVHYSLSPHLVGDSLVAVRIELRFAGDTDGETTLNLPNEWGGESNLFEAIRDLNVTGGTLRDGADAAHRVVTHAPDAPLTVSYEVVQEQPGPPSADGDNPYRPIIQPGYFHLIGEAAFVVPAWPGETIADFQVAGLPAGWGFASDVQHARPGHPLTLADLQESITVGGDFRVITRPHAGGDLRVAIRGKWAFTDDGLADKIDRIVASHLQFWGDPEEPFLVTVLPLATEGQSSSLGGTGRSDAFAFFATDNGQEATINRILAHEHLHTWIPRRLGRMPVEDEATAYWLSEGFTDFYTFRLLVHDGLWSPRDFLDAANEVLMKYAQSSVRTAPNTKILAEFWSSREAQDLPYQRGFLLAMLWDQRLRKASRGKRDLDDVMLALRRQFTKYEKRDDAPLVTEAFARAMRDARCAIDDDLAYYVENGAAVLLPQDLLAPAGRLETLDLPEFDRGFDPLKTAAAGNIVAGIDSTGPAFAAGLRNGMKILKRESGQPDNPAIEFVYRILDTGTEKVIRYLPAGKRTFVTQRLAPGAGGDADAALRRRLAGE